MTKGSGPNRGSECGKTIAYDMLNYLSRLTFAEDKFEDLCYVVAIWPYGIECVDAEFAEVAEWLDDVGV